MRRIIIVVEGQTEQDFVHQCLGPYMFERYGIPSISARLIGKPGFKGGNVKFSRLKLDIDIILKEPTVLVSTFIDFYRLENDFPNYESCTSLHNVNQQIECLELALAHSIDNELFIPYIQKYEFEALLFSSEVGFQKYLGIQACAALDQIRLQFVNPEDINSGNPPSHRLIDIFEQYERIKYNKRVYGNIFALEIGIDSILNSCQRFANWIDQIGGLAINN